MEVHPVELAPVVIDALADGDLHPANRAAREATVRTVRAADGAIAAKALRRG